MRLRHHAHVVVWVPVAAWWAVLVGVVCAWVAVLGSVVLALMVATFVGLGQGRQVAQAQAEAQARAENALMTRLDEAVARWDMEALDGVLVELIHRWETANAVTNRVYANQ